MSEKVSCKFCPFSEISLRREAHPGPRGTGYGMKRYCTFYEGHINPHKKRVCETGYNAIKEKGARVLYPFEGKLKAEDHE